jgi:hypothetical protein
MISASIVPLGPLVAVPETGEYLVCECPTQVATAAVGTVSATVLYVSKILVPKRMSFDRAALYLQTQQASAQGWIAVYKWNNGKRNGATLIKDFGVLDLSTGQGAAVLSAAASLTLNSGPYWIATWIKSGTTTPTLEASSASGTSGTLPWATAVGSQPARKFSVTDTFPTTNPPSPITAALIPTGGAMPLPMLRAA